MLPQVESTATQVERVGLILSRLTQLIFSDRGQHVDSFRYRVHPNTHDNAHIHKHVRTTRRARSLSAPSIGASGTPRARHVRKARALHVPSRDRATPQRGRSRCFCCAGRRTPVCTPAGCRSEAPPRRHAAVDAHALTYSLCMQGGEKVRSNQRTAPAHAGVQMCVAAGESEERTARLSGHEWRAAVGVPT